MNNNTILFLGGSSKLGVFTIKYLIKLGYNVLLCSRSIKIAQNLCSILSEKVDNYNIGTIKPITVELSNKLSIDSLLDSLRNCNNYPNIVINAAAIDNQDKIIDLSFKMIQKIHTTNFVGSAYLASRISTFWIDNKIEGKFCTISTLLSYLGCEKSAIYASSKAALESFFINLAIELGKNNIRSNIIRIAGMLGNLKFYDDKLTCPSLNEVDYSNTTLKKSIIPLNRYARFNEFSRVIEFLISNNSSYINGQCINVDGGLSSIYPGYQP